MIGEVSVWLDVGLQVESTFKVEYYFKENFIYMIVLIKILLYQMVFTMKLANNWCYLLHVVK